MSSPLTPHAFEKSDVDGWKAHLESEGFVVIKDILSPEEKTHAFDLFKRDLNTVSTNFNFEDKTTWTIENCPLMFGKGMAVFNGFGQSDFMWNLRLNSQIQAIFKSIYECDDLTTSLDGFSMFVSKHQKSKPWLHIDQNPANTIYSIQGAYNFMPVNSVQDAGFVLVPKSHETYKSEVAHKKNWIVCDTTEPILAESRKLIIPENCMTLWNSKTIHANEGMTKSGVELNRLTTYITYQPKVLRSDSILHKRINAYKDARTTSHWANKCELKSYPFGFKSRYESRGYHKITSKLDENGEIPAERLALL